MSSIVERTFDVTIIILHVAYVAVVVGLLDRKPEYLINVDFWLKVFMAVFLIVRFNPFTSVKFTEFDRKVVFGTGLFLFTVTIVNNYLQTYIESLKKNIRTVFGADK
uniref:Uncharacterized protein n=1 Tax=viral metagenome TaxID=1070528 RepID=A0A6C0CGV7_9ZZZZ